MESDPSETTKNKRHDDAVGIPGIFDTTRGQTPENGNHGWDEDGVTDEIDATEGVLRRWHLLCAEEYQNAGQ